MACKQILFITTAEKSSYFTTSYIVRCSFSLYSVWVVLNTTLFCPQPR